MIRVRGGTRGNERLCDTCRRSTIIKGSGDSQEMVMCHLLESEPPYRVVECSGYDDVRIPSKFDLYQTAWILETKKAGRDIGFKPYKQWKKENKEDTSEYD